MSAVAHAPAFLRAHFGPVPPDEFVRQRQLEIFAYKPLADRLHDVVGSTSSRSCLLEAKRPAYTTVQAMVYRRDDAGRRIIDDLLALFGGQTKPVMAQLVESGNLTVEDVREAEQAILKLARSKTPGKERQL